MSSSTMTSCGFSLATAPAGPYVSYWTLLTWVHAAMGAMQVRKHELGGFSMGDDFEQRMMPFLQTDPFANMKYVVVHLAYHTQRNAGLESDVSVLEAYAGLAANVTGPLLPL
ncbi:hypothetical protein WJX79_001373 [Trebouxia sp. C0005]